jgi:peptidoglycan hydrolase CwlO-like protein
MSKKNTEQEPPVVEVDPEKIKKTKLLISVQTVIMLVGFSFTVGLIYSNFSTMKQSIESLKSQSSSDKKELIDKIEELNKKASDIQERTGRLEGKIEILTIKK